MIVDPLLNLYFTSPAEAVFSLFREPIVAPFELSIGQPLSETPQRTNQLDDLYLNTFYLNEDLIIRPLPNSNLERELKTDPNLAEVREAIRNDCVTSARDGFVIPYLPVLFYQDGDRVARLTGKITTYILCRQNLLLHTQSFRILKQVLIDDLRELIALWKAQNRTYRVTGGVVVDLLTRYLKENRDRVLEEVYVQPETTGLATSPVSSINSPLTPPTLPLPIEESPFIEPPSSMLSPKDPRDFIAQKLSPGETTAYDAFATVPNDVLRVMALNMTLDTLAKTCSISRRFNDQVCNRDKFWALRVQQDYARRSDPAKNEKIMQRKPESWSWKRYYAELSGNLFPNQVLDFAELRQDAELLAELDNLSREDYEARVNEMRREAGLGVIDFERLEFQASRKPSKQQPNVRRRLVFEPMVGPGVMGPVVENPEVGLLGEQPDVNRFQIPAQDFDRMNRQFANILERQQRERDINRVIPEPAARRIGVFPLRGRRFNDEDQRRNFMDNIMGRIPGQVGLDLRGIPDHLLNINPAAPIPEDPTAIGRLFASQEDYQDFFQRYSPHLEMGQRLRPLEAGDVTPQHLMNAFDEYRDLLFAIRGGEPYEEFREEIFEELLERARLIGEDPFAILDNQINTIQRIMRDGGRWPEGSRHILLREFRNYMVEHQNNQPENVPGALLQNREQRPVEPLPNADVVYRTLSLFKQLNDANDREEYLRSTRFFFDLMIQNARRRNISAQAILIEFNQLILANRLYAQELGDFMNLLHREFREYLAQQPGGV